MDKKSISCSTNLFWGRNVIQTLSQTMLKWTWWVMCSVNFNSNWSRLNSLAPKTYIRNFCLHTSSCWMCLAKLIHHRYLLTAPLSFFSHYTFCLPFMFFLWCCQEGAMKPYTSAIMTPERLGDEFTSVMWNSAHVWRGKSAVKESATQVRRHLFFFGPDCVCRQAFVLPFNSQLNRGGGNYFVLNSPCMWRQHLNPKQKLTRGRSWQFHICAEHERWIRATLWY